MTRASGKSSIVGSMVFLLVALCPGCARQSYTKQQFVLEAARPTSPAGPRRDIVLAVRGFAIDPACDGKGLMYRKGQNEYESDFYHEFLVAPQVLISSQTRRWLAQSGRFRMVLEPGSLLEPTHILEGNVLALHGDFRGRDLPQAVLQMRVFLVANKRAQPEVVFTRDYQASCPARERTADALVTALDQCLVQVLSTLEKDLGEAL